MAGPQGAPDVCSWPCAAKARKTAQLFDHLVGTGEQGRRHVEAERLGADHDSEEAAEKVRDGQAKRMAELVAEADRLLGDVCGALGEPGLPQRASADAACAYAGVMGTETLSLHLPQPMAPTDFDATRHRFRDALLGRDAGRAERVH
jgi:hypothetical protein